MKATKAAKPTKAAKATIANHQIDNIASFNAATSEPHQIAGIYFFYKLDCLIDLAHKVSHDFYDRPELFTDLKDAAGNTIAPTLAKLHARYGCEESYLNKERRQAIYSALFGKSTSTDSSADEEGDFPNLRDELIEACATFVETKFGDEESLRENVKQKHRLFKEYLTGLKGDSVTWSRDNSLSVHTEQVSYPILRNKGVSAVYGIATPARDAWPYSFDSNADKLVEKISKQLMRPEQAGEMNSDGKREMHPYISREAITNLQRAAIEGANAIATVIDVDAGSNDEDVNLLIRKCYTWGTALKNLKNHPRTYSTTFVSRAAEKPRGGVAVAQPLAGDFVQSNVR